MAATPVAGLAQALVVAAASPSVATLRRGNQRQLFVAPCFLSALFRRASQSSGRGYGAGCSVHPRPNRELAMHRTFRLPCCPRWGWPAAGPVPEAPIHTPGAVTTPELVATLAERDHALFDAWFGCGPTRCGPMTLTGFRKFPNDKHGRSHPARNCGEQSLPVVGGSRAPIFHSRRELVPGTLETYALNDYGAVQLGTHRLCSAPQARSAHRNQPLFVDVEAGKKRRVETVARSAMGMSLIRRRNRALSGRGAHNRGRPFRSPPCRCRCTRPRCRCSCVCLANLRAVLQTGEAFIDKWHRTGGVARPAPDRDMFPTRQVQIATDMAYRAAARYWPPAPSPRPSPDTETDKPAVRASTAPARWCVTPPRRRRQRGSRHRRGRGRDPLRMDGQSHLFHFPKPPNLFFHASIAYAILREAGVALGKDDFPGAD